MTRYRWIFGLFALGLTCGAATLAPALADPVPLAQRRPDRPSRPDLSEAEIKLEEGLASIQQGWWMRRSPPLKPQQP
jgi:hypothetical protein